MAKQKSIQKRPLRSDASALSRIVLALHNPLDRAGAEVPIFDPVSSYESLVLAVDGGGTATRAIVVDLLSGRQYTGQSGGSNPNNAGATEAAIAIETAVSQALPESEGQSIAPVAACFGIAGLASPQQREALFAALKATNPMFGRIKRMRLTHDLEIAHCGAFAGGPGVCLIAGTGSACYAKGTAGEAFRASGRAGGYDDPGSGYAIGKAAIDFGYATLTTRTGRAATAELARTLLQAAEDGDQQAAALLRDEAKLLIEMAAPAIRSIARGATAVALVGGMLERDSLYRQIVVESLIESFPSAIPMAPLFPPIHGALQIARSLADEA